MLPDEKTFAVNEPLTRAQRPFLSPIGCADVAVALSRMQKQTGDDGDGGRSSFARVPRAIPRKVAGELRYSLKDFNKSMSCAMS
jgi:hypothetical protein